MGGDDGYGGNKKDQDAICVYNSNICHDKFIFITKSINKNYKIEFP